MNHPKVIVAISNALQRRYGIPGGLPTKDFDVVGKIVACQAAMPDYLRLVIQLLTWIFDYTSLVTSGSRFSSISSELQNRQLDAWRSSRFDVFRKFVYFYESLYLRIVMDEDAQ